MQTLTRPPRTSRRIRLGESLVEAALITQPQLDDALVRQTTTGERLGQALLALGYISEGDLVRTLARDAEIPFLEAHELRIDPAVVPLVPAAVARGDNLAPIRADGGTLVVAMANPFDIGVIRSLERTSGRNIRTVAADPAVISRIVESHYGPASSERPSFPKILDRASNPAARTSVGTSTDLARTSGPTAFRISPYGAAAELLGGAKTGDGQTATDVIDEVFRCAVTLGATDIHVEPLAEMVRVRYRIDGILRESAAYPKALRAAVVGRLKGLCGLDKDESKVSQMGRANLTVDGRSLDLRLSSCPTIHGEDIALHLLDASGDALQLDGLGASLEDVELLRAELRRQRGLILLTGAAGSGRMTTLYAIMRELARVDRRIFSIEDPIEHEMPSIRQAQVNAAAGLTFASGVRSILRLDPDVILIGALRDRETMQIALSAAMTGRLLVAPLEAEMTAAAIPRLVDMGADPVIVASTVSLIVGQRLVRCLCSECKNPVTLPRVAAERFGLQDSQVFGPRGCERCGQSGYRGRSGLFELLPVTESVAASISSSGSVEDIRQAAGRPSFLEHGLVKVRDGATSLDEVLRVVA